MWCHSHVILKLALAHYWPGVQARMVLCLVFGCSKCSGRDKDVSFFRIPKIIHNKGETVYSLSKKRREGFLAAISRVGLTEKIMKNDRICSRHFVSGKPADLWEDTSPDWLPTLNLGHAKVTCSADATGRWERCKAREAARAMILHANTHEPVDNSVDNSLPIESTENELAEIIPEESAETATLVDIASCWNEGCFYTNWSCWRVRAIEVYCWEFANEDQSTYFLWRGLLKRLVC